MSFPSDLEIASGAQLKSLTDVAGAAGIPLHRLEPYGSGAAKIDLAAIDEMQDRPMAKYVVVSAITPTPLGEGKTTTAVGLAQGFRHIDRRATLAIRQPSMGPTFGIKGGAAGGSASFGVGQSEFEFIDRYVAFLIAYDLARVDFATWTEALVERQLVGHFLAPLTARGKRLRDFVAAADAGADGDRRDPYDVAIQERYVQMLINPRGHDELLVRQRRIEQVRLILAED